MKREVAVKTGNFRRVCPINGRRFRLRTIVFWILRRVRRQSEKGAQDAGEIPVFIWGERKRPEWCSLESERAVPIIL